MATGILVLAAFVLAITGKRPHAVLVATLGVGTTGLLFSPVGVSVAPDVAFPFLVPASAAAVFDASGLAIVSERATGTKLAELKQIGLGLAVLGSLFALVYATGPIGAVGAVLAPFIFWLSLRWLA